MSDEILKLILNELQAVTGDIKDLKLEMNQRFEQVDKRFEQMDKRFDQLEEKVDLLQVHTNQAHEQGVELIHSIATLNGNVEGLQEVVYEIQESNQSFQEALEFLEHEVFDHKKQLYMIKRSKPSVEKEKSPSNR
jgi:chromosome segregation ATPase